MVEMNMKNVVVGSGLCPLAVRFQMRGGNGDLNDVVARIKNLKSGIRKGGKLFRNYPQSLFDEILSWDEINPDYMFVEGARSSVVIAQKVIKSFCGNSVRSVMAYTVGEKNGGATKEVEKSLSQFDIEPLFSYLPKGRGDNQIDIVIEDMSDHSTARMYQASRRSFRYKCDLEKIEKELKENVNVLMLNRAAKGAKDSATTLLSRNKNNLVSFRIHNFSRHAGVSENADMLESANFIFITDPEKDQIICQDLKRYYDVENLDELARRILEINDIKRLVVMPPSEECENLRFYTTDFNRCVEVKCPDSPRAKTAWLNGACVALTCKDWQGKPPFELENRFPKTYRDFELFCDWATQLAYSDYAGEDFKITESWIIE